MNFEKPLLLCGTKRCCPTLHSTGSRARVTDDFGNDVTLSDAEWFSAIDGISTGGEDKTVKFAGVEMYRSQAQALKKAL